MYSEIMAVRRHIWRGRGGGVTGWGRREKILDLETIIVAPLEFGSANL